MCLFLIGKYDVDVVSDEFSEEIPFVFYNVVAGIFTISFFLNNSFLNITLDKLFNEFLKTLKNFNIFTPFEIYYFLKNFL